MPTSVVSSMPEFAGDKTVSDEEHQADVNSAVSAPTWPGSIGATEELFDEIEAAIRRGDKWAALGLLGELRRPQPEPASQMAPALRIVKG